MIQFIDSRNFEENRKHMKKNKLVVYRPWVHIVQSNGVSQVCKKEKVSSHENEELKSWDQSKNLKLASKILPAILIKLQTEVKYQALYFQFEC